MNAPERIWAFYAPEIAEDNNGATIVAHETLQHGGAPFVRSDLFAAEKARADKAEALLTEAVDILDLGVELVNQDDLTDSAGWDAFDAQARATLAKIKEVKNG